MIGRRVELEFLPAAVEVAETPASPASRLIVILVAVVVITAVMWCWLSVVDVVATATGRTIPAGRVKTIQPLELGVVRLVHVRDGQTVRHGDVLIDLDPTASAADRDRLTRELMAARLDGSRLSAMVTTEPFAPPTGAEPALVVQQRALLHAQRQEHHARLASIDGDIGRRRSERAAIQATLTKLERTIPLVRDREQSYGVLARRGFVARLTHVELEQALIEHEQELVAQRHRLEEAAAQVAMLTEQRRQVEAEHRRVVLGQLADVETRAASLAQEVVKADRRQTLHRLRAPIDGVVQQLAVHTVGGVVTPGQALMTVVPSRQVIEVEAFVLNRDVGFVRAGQPAEIKVETFPFTRYGTVPGQVGHVSADAVAHERLGLVYPVRVGLTKASIDVDGRPIALTPGLSVTLEIRIGERRVLEYLLAPLLRYAAESFRER